jgi:hypothetical protein
MRSELSPVVALAEGQSLEPRNSQSLFSNCPPQDPNLSLFNPTKGICDDYVVAFETLSRSIIRKGHQYRERQDW